jgi:hypothetical protein
MGRAPLTAVVLAPLVVLAACGDDAGAVPDAGVVDLGPEEPGGDGATPDAGVVDLGPEEPGGDGATPDAGPGDAGGGDVGTSDGGTCGGGAGIDAAAALEGVLFPSESDYPWSSFGPVGSGATRVSPEVVAEAAGLAGLTETRVFSEFWSRFERDPAAAAYSAAKDILERRLSSLTVVRVIPTATPAEVHVFVVGLTPCGELVGIRTISIET